MFQEVALRVRHILHHNELINSKTIPSSIKKQGRVCEKKLTCYLGQILKHDFNIFSPFQNKTSAKTLKGSKLRMY